jgi:hypothetical protein
MAIPRPITISRNHSSSLSSCLLHIGVLCLCVRPITHFLYTLHIIYTRSVYKRYIRRYITLLLYTAYMPGMLGTSILDTGI